MNTASKVLSMLSEWKAQGLSKAQLVVKLALACLGWPYVYGGRGETCNPSNRRSRKNDKYPTIVSKCQVLNGTCKDCNGCQWYPGGNALFFDCRGFTYWVLLKAAGITIKGGGATTQYNTNSNWAEKGPIANMPKDKVCCVFRYDTGTGKYEHTLLYDGNGNYIHCSGTVLKVSTSKYRATHYAIPKGLYAGSSSAPSVPSATPAEGAQTAIVTAANGKPVKMRQQPSESCRTWDALPVGTVVTVEGAVKGNFTQISYGTRKGWWMMTKFLKM